VSRSLACPLRLRQSPRRSDFVQTLAAIPAHWGQLLNWLVGGGGWRPGTRWCHRSPAAVICAVVCRTYACDGCRCGRPWRIAHAKISSDSTIRFLRVHRDGLVCNCARWRNCAGESAGSPTRRKPSPAENGSHSRFRHGPANPGPHCGLSGTHICLTPRAISAPVRFAPDPTLKNQEVS